MKSFLSFLFLVAMGIQLNAQTINITGSVVDLNTNAGVAGDTVYVYSDSVNGTRYFRYTITDVNGNYSKQVTVPTGVSSLNYYVSVFDCNRNLITKTVKYPDSMNSYTANLSICTIPTKCYAYFTYVQDSVNPLKFNFYYKNSKPGITYYWSFGDSSHSTNQNPVHTYTTHGTYIIDLYIHDSVNNCSDLHSVVIQTQSLPLPKTITITGKVADSITNIGVDGYKVHFSYTINGLNYTYVSFTDNFGNYSRQFTIPSGVSNITYNVTVVDCQNNHITKQVRYPRTINNYTANFSICIGPSYKCSAYFTYVQDSLNPLKFNFYCDYTGPGVVYSWHFGNSTHSVNQNPVHTYTSHSTYRVDLLVYDSANNCSDNFYRLIKTQPPPPPTHGHIYGTVYTGSAYADYATAYLIKYNPIDSSLTAVDTFNIDSAGRYSFYAPFGRYLLKAALKPSSTSYSNYLPTYYDTALFWHQGTYVVVNSSTLFQNSDIHLLSGTNPGGPGFIGGKIANGARSNNDGIAGIQVILLDDHDRPVAYTYSKEDGVFEFDNIPLGIFNVYAEIPGLISEGIETTIDTDNPSTNKLRFYVHQKNITVGMAEDISPQIKSVSQIYPNPTQEYFNLDINLIESTSLNITILDQMGRMIMTTEEKFKTGLNKFSYNSQDLLPGIYYLIVNAQDGTLLNRKFMKTN